MLSDRQTVIQNNSRGPVLMQAVGSSSDMLRSREKLKALREKESPLLMNSRPFERTRNADGRRGVTKGEHLPQKSRH